MGSWRIGVTGCAPLRREREPDIQMAAGPAFQYAASRSPHHIIPLVEVVAEPPVLGPTVIDASVVDTPVIEVGVPESQIEIVTPTGHRISVRFDSEKK